MATYTLRPNANWNNASAFTISGGSGSVHAALADSSDSTYITRTSTTVPASYEAEFGTQTLAATERVAFVKSLLLIFEQGQRLEQRVRLS